MAGKRKFDDVTNGRVEALKKRRKGISASKNVGKTAAKTIESSKAAAVTAAAREASTEMPKKQIIVVKSIYLSLSNLECIRELGRGSYGRVFAVRLKERYATAGRKSPNNVYALKAQQMINTKNDHDSVRRKRNEERILRRIPWNPFLANYITSFNDDTHLYFLLEFVPHGTFSDILDNAPSCQIMECSAAFYYANILCGIEFLHSLDIVHRDIKPDNILVGADGYLAITDLGLAKDRSSVGGWVYYGTASYLPPECATPCSAGPSTLEDAKMIDWWASGCIAFEMCSGRFAFDGGSDSESDSQSSDIRLRKRIVSVDINWPTPGTLSPELTSFVSSLLTKDMRYRLGYDGGADEIKTHPWLKSIRWDEILDRTEIAPWLPERIDVALRALGEIPPDTTGFENFDMADLS